MKIRNAEDEVVPDGSLSAGVYCIIVQDNNGCIASQDCFEVTEPDEMEATATVSNQDCDELGSIALSIIGGTAPYSFDWNGIDSSNLVFGTYTVTITDINNCQSILENLVVELECVDCVDPQMNSTIMQQSSCGNDDGSITILMDGGNNNYNYNWGHTTDNSNSVNNLFAGSYQVTISDINNPNCIIVETFTLSDETEPTVNIIDTNAANCLAADGTAELSPADLSYTWSDLGTGAVRTDLEAGNYIVTATDSNGCSSIVEITIGVESPLIGTYTIDAQADCGQSNGQATINVTGGSGDYSYSPFGPVITNISDGSLTAIGNG